MTTRCAAIPWGRLTTGDQAAYPAPPRAMTPPSSVARGGTSLELWLIFMYVAINGVADLRAAKAGFQIGPVPIFFTDIVLLLLLTASFARWPSRLLYWGSEGVGAGPVGRAVWLICILALSYFAMALNKYHLLAARDLAIWGYSIFFPLTYFAIRRSRDASKVLLWLTYGGVIASVLLLFQQTTGIDVGLFTPQNRFLLNHELIALRSGDANAFSIYSLVSLIAYIAYSRRLRTFHIACAVVCLLALISGAVRSGFVAVLAACAVTFYHLDLKSRARFLLLGALFALPVVTAPALPSTLPEVSMLRDFGISIVSAASGPATDANSRFRLVRWHYARAVWAAHPILGAGFGTPIIPSGLIDRNEAEGKFNAGMPHNSLLLVAARTGLLGLSLFVCSWILVLIWLFKRLARSRDADALAAANLLAAMLVFAMLGLFLERPGTNATFWIVMAVSARLVESGRTRMRRAVIALSRFLPPSPVRTQSGASTRSLIPRRSHLLILPLAVMIVAAFSSVLTAAEPTNIYQLQTLLDRALPGAVIEIPPGVYRGSIQIAQSGTATNPIVIEGRGGEVVISGADLLIPERWQPLGAEPIWRYLPWTYRARTIRPDNSGRIYSGAQVIADGTPLSRAESLQSMVAGTFFDDSTGVHALFVWLPDGSSPAMHTMEASVRARLLNLTGSHITFRNVKFRYASNTAQQAAVNVDGEDNVLEDCIVEYTGGVGLHLTGRHNVARRVQSRFNGQMGMGVNGQYNVLEYCKLFHNNTLDYPISWEAGGIKIVGTKQLRISNCVAAENKGAGFWFDLDNRDGTIEHSYASDNQTGIMVEISRGIQVRDNVAVRNGLQPNSGWDSAGILIGESLDTTVEHNTCISNRTGIAVRQQRLRTLPANFRADRPTPVHFNSAGLVLRNNIVAFNRDWQFALFGDNRFFAAKNLSLAGEMRNPGDPANSVDLQLLDPSNWNWRLDHNVYFASPGAGLILWGAPWLPGHRTYASVDAFRREHHLDQNSIVANPEFVDRQRGNLSLRPNSRAYAVIQ